MWQSKVDKVVQKNQHFPQMCWSITEKRHLALRLALTANLTLSQVGENFDFGGSE